MELPKSIAHINIAKMKPANKGITFYLNVLHEYDWDKDEMEEIGEIIGAFAEFQNHEEMIYMMKDYYGMEV